MYFTAKSILSALVGATAVSAQCAGPPANAATVSLIAEFEGFRPNICKSYGIITLVFTGTDSE